MFFVFLLPALRLSSSAQFRLAFYRVTTSDFEGESTEVLGSRTAPVAFLFPLFFFLGREQFF